VLRERQTETVERRPRSPSPVRVRERVVERERSPSADRLRTRVVETRERIRERSPSPVRLRERIIERRERTPSPVRVRERIIERRERTPSPVRDERIRITETRETRRERTPSLSPSPSPPPSIRAPPIHQEVITHHRHIDHGRQSNHSVISLTDTNLGYERARVPTPPPPPRRSSPRIKETDIDIYTSRNNTEIDIHKTDTRSRTPQPPRRESLYDDDHVYERERDRLRVSDNTVSLSRRRSTSARPPQRERTRIDIRDDESESSYYARKASDRAYIGEGYNGATKDWAIVDVPPGTERVRMDGVGGASEEITWQKYNGVRRSNFIPERERETIDIQERSVERPRREPNLEIEISSRRRKGGAVYKRDYERIEESSDRRVGLPRGPKNRVGTLWTEITKDLVTKEAIEQLGYDYEETEFFYYIIQYLQYVRSPFPTLLVDHTNTYSGGCTTARNPLRTNPPRPPTPHPRNRA
jgi:hypothetical protein